MAREDIYKMARARSRDTSPSSRDSPPPNQQKLTSLTPVRCLRWPAKGYITPLKQITLRFCAIPQKHYKLDASHVGVVTRSERRVLRTPCNRSPSPLVLEADSRRLSKSCGNLTLKPVMELPFDSSTLSLMWLIRNRNLASSLTGLRPLWLPCEAHSDITLTIWMRQPRSLTSLLML